MSKGDLALAKKCAQWPEARTAMRTHLDRWEKEGFSFTLDWLLRNTSAVATGRAGFSSLDTVPVTDFQQNCTLLWCTQTVRAVVVDPGGDLPRIRRTRGKLGHRPRYRRCTSTFRAGQWSRF